VPEAIRARADASEGVMNAALPVQPSEDEHEIWRTPEARLAVRRDARTARNVLIEERAQPLTDDAIERLRNIAAAGGPFVQRILRLSDDRRAIWYEAIAGAEVAIDELADEERRPLERAIASLPPGAARFAARTPAGPVVLIAPERPGV
jgi:hypothetical protein